MSSRRSHFCSGRRRKLGRKDALENLWENFWGMILIKQIHDFISCAIWNVFSRQAFICPARGRDSIPSAAPSTSWKSGTRVTSAYHDRPKTKTKLHGLSLRANYTDRATAACRRSDCQLVQIEGAMWSAWRIPTAVFLGFLDRSRYFSIK
jgi:hypothetical protein